MAHNYAEAHSLLTINIMYFIIDDLIIENTFKRKIIVF